MAMDAITVLLVASLILFFGFFAEFVFRKFSIPDVLFLIVLGFVIGPNGFGYVNPESFIIFAPIFTTFTLLFLLFDGGFNINLSSLMREFSQSFLLTTFNFLTSSILIAIIFYIFGYLWFGGVSIALSLLTGFLLGGVSSSFVIPILKEMNLSPKIYSLLTLESALTDVLCIVSSLTVMTFLSLGSFAFQETSIQLISLFAIAGLVGVVGGVIWIFLVLKVFREHNYIILIAYLLLLYVTTEFLKGNGAIAALVFGIMLKNSKQLSSIFKGVVSTKAGDKKKAIKGELGTSVITHSEEYFYHQISFFLKTFFFVYIGILIDISDWGALVVGGIISVAILFSRMGSNVLTKNMVSLNRSLVNSIFARGLAAAVIAQIAIIKEVPHAEFIGKVAYIVITGTIILSSAKVFLVKRKMPEKNTQKHSLKKKGVKI
jgi:potassium/hydrogen antiporter